MGDFSPLDTVQTEYQVRPVVGGAPLNRQLRLAVALLEVLSGLLVIGLMAWFVAQGNGMGGWLFLSFESIGVFSILAGVLLWRDKILGYELSEILQLLQVVRFQFVAFSLVLATGAELLIIWSANGPSWYIGLNATVTFGRPAVAVPYVGVNVAAAFLYHLIRKGRLHALALERQPLPVSTASVSTPIKDIAPSA